MLEHKLRDETGLGAINLFDENTKRKSRKKKENIMKKTKRAKW